MLSQGKKPIQGVAQRVRFGGTLKCRKVGAANWGNSTKKAAEGGVVSAIDNPKRPQEEILKTAGLSPLAVALLCKKRNDRLRGYSDGKELSS